MSLVNFLAKESPVSPSAQLLRKWWSSPLRSQSPCATKRPLGSGMRAMSSRTAGGLGPKTSGRAPGVQRGFSSSHAMMSTQSSSRNVSMQQRRELVDMLKPHVFIHLARSRFTSTDADDGFRRGWVSEKQVETAIHGSVVKEMKVLALTGELNYAALQQRVQFIMDKTVQSLNRDYSVNAQSEHYVPSHHIDAQNMRLADSAIQDVKPSERQSDPFGEFTEESIQDEDERSRKERLFEEQMDLETKTLEEAVAKYRMLSYDLKKAGRGTAMKPSEHLMMSWFEPMTEHLMQLAEADTMSATARLMFGTLDAEALACLAMHELVVTPPPPPPFSPPPFSPPPLSPITQLWRSRTQKHQRRHQSTTLHAHHTALADPHKNAHDHLLR